MNNNTLQIKFKQRLNKIDSQDYDNIQPWEIAEAFNKAQIEWCRRQLSGTNIRKEGDEMSKRRIDDLSLLLKRVNLTGQDIAYDGAFGFFNATNFKQIYDPELGGDYLEFKRIECAAQQCFPSIPEIVNTELIDQTATTEGFWQSNYNVNQAPYMFNTPVFSFLSNGNTSVSLESPEQNLVANWGAYGEVSDTTPNIDSQIVTTQQPWVWNSQVAPVKWYTSSAGNNLPDIWNTNLISPYQGQDGILSSCFTCGMTAGDILNDSVTLTQMCNNSTTGYLVGGPNNEYIDCTTIPATSNSIPHLAISGTDIDTSTYNFTNSDNNWVNTIPDIFGSGVVPSCENNGCWFVPNSVEIQTFSASNFQTFANAWSDLSVEQLEDSYVEGTSTDFQIEQTTRTPFESCYCAPGADKENFCVKPRTMTVYQSEVANVDVLLRDPLKRPDFEWAETFVTMQAYDNTDGGATAGIRIWRRNFYIMDPVLVYYRTPRRIRIANSVDPYTGLQVPTDVACEFKDDIVEILIDSAVSTLAGDISDANQMMRGEQAAEKNN